MIGHNDESYRREHFAHGRRRVYHQGTMDRPIRILGIDPGLRRTGWGVVEIAGNRLSFLGCGSVTTDDREALAARLWSSTTG